MAENRKFYWLKLKKDFFKRHDIKIIENMPNGKDYILFYLKLLLESVPHEGNLRFSDAIPYSEHMLATITDTNIDIVRSAMKMFIELKMIDVFDDKTIYMEEVNKMIGCESSVAERVRKHRDTQKTLQCNTDVTTCNEMVTQSKSKSIEIDIDIKEIGKKPSRFTPPTAEEVKQYCLERANNVDSERFIDFYSSKGWLVGKTKMKDWKASIRTWEKEDKKTPSVSKPKNNNKFNNFAQREYDYDALEKKLQTKQNGGN